MESKFFIGATIAAIPITAYVGYKVGYRKAESDCMPIVKELERDIKRLEGKIY